MNLINDLDTEIAFAFLIEKKHKQKIRSQDVLPLIGRLNKALKQISEKEEETAEGILGDNPQTHFAVH